MSSQQRCKKVEAKQPAQVHMLPAFSRLRVQEEEEMDDTSTLMRAGNAPADTGGPFGDALSNFVVSIEERLYNVEQSVAQNTKTLHRIENSIMMMGQDAEVQHEWRNYLLELQRSGVVAQKLQAELLSRVAQLEQNAKPRSELENK